MDDTTSAIVLTVIGSNGSGTIWTPKDGAIRTRAEETLAAMIANALRDGAGEPREA